MPSCRRPLTTKGTKGDTLVCGCTAHDRDVFAGWPPAGAVGSGRCFQYNADHDRGRRLGRCPLHSLAGTRRTEPQTRLRPHAGAPASHPRLTALLCEGHSCLLDRQISPRRLCRKENACAALSHSGMSHSAWEKRSHPAALEIASPPETVHVLPTVMWAAICYLTWAWRCKCTRIAAWTSPLQLQRLFSWFNDMPTPPSSPPILPSPRSLCAFHLCIVSLMRHAPMGENQDLSETRQSETPLLARLEIRLSRVLLSKSQLTCRTFHVFMPKYTLWGLHRRHACTAETKCVSV